LWAKRPRGGSQMRRGRGGKGARRVERTTKFRSKDGPREASNPSGQLKPVNPTPEQLISGTWGSFRL